MRKQDLCQVGIQIKEESRALIMSPGPHYAATCLVQFLLPGQTPQKTSGSVNTATESFSAPRLPSPQGRPERPFETLARPSRRSARQPPPPH